MIWLTLVRAGTILSLGTALLHLIDQRTREINPSRIYSSIDAARFLGASRRVVVELVKKNEIRGKMVRGNFRIMGQSIIEYINK
jgi:excisionase family DNA binding protein